MPPALTELTWNRDRVRNFVEPFATAYAQALVEMTGWDYEQSQLMEGLVERGVVALTKAAGLTGDARQELLAKRWDTYIGKIREYGLGFAVRKKPHGFQTERTVWEASPIARLLSNGRLSYREFMAIQWSRTQFPRVNLPFQPQARAELDAGALVRPAEVLLRAQDFLTSVESEIFLTTQTRPDQRVG